MRSQTRGLGEVVAHRSLGGFFERSWNSDASRRSVWDGAECPKPMDKALPRLVFGAVAVALGVVVAGCGDGGSRPAPQTAPAAAPAPAPAPEPEASAEPRPTLVVAAAQPSSPGKEQAMRVVCGAGLVDPERARCAQAVSAASYLDPLAVDLCASFVAPDERIGCVSAIGNRWYTIAETRACTRAVVHADRLACLKAAGSTRGPAARDEGRGAASDLCAQLREVGERQRCIESVAPAKLFARDAVRVCASLLASQDRITCLGKVRDRSYAAKDIAACEKKRTVDERLACLGASGRSAELARAMK